MVFALINLIDFRSVVIGFDDSSSSLRLSKIARETYISFGVNVIDIGLTGTEQMYAAVSEFNASGGVAIIASHQGPRYNGIKIVKASSESLSDLEFRKIREQVELGAYLASNNSVRCINPREETIKVDMSDGLSAYFENWGFNLRKSYTEKLVRLNVEASRDKALLE